MSAYSKIEEIAASPKYGNTGADGWGFTLWSDLLDDEAPHRALLERLSAAAPEAGIVLPKYDRYEDYIECDAKWASSAVWIYYETILSYLYFWSADRRAVEGVRDALLPLLDLN
jgi:hypothetical protein